MGLAVNLALRRRPLFGHGHRTLGGLLGGSLTGELFQATLDSQSTDAKGEVRRGADGSLGQSFPGYFSGFCWNTKGRPDTGSSGG